MVIILVFWNIRDDPAAETKFLNLWNKDMPVLDRKDLIQETLCRPSEGDRDVFPAINRNAGNVLSFTTIGLWLTSKAIMDQLGKYFKEQNYLAEFEARPRHRVLLEPAFWRRGQSSLMLTDSEGTW